MRGNTSMTVVLLIALSSLLACGKDDTATPSDNSDDTASSICAAVSDSHVLWDVTVTPSESTCGDLGASWSTVYSIRHSGVGYNLITCDGVEAAGVIGGCQWDYAADEHTERGDLPAGGIWELEGQGYAWEEPVDYCVLPDGLDWETEEVWTLKDPGTTGLADGCKVTYVITGTVRSTAR